MAEIRQTQGDTYPTWKMVCKDDDGNRINITGATFAGYIVSRLTNNILITLGGNFVIITASQGTLEYQQLESDTNAGNLQAGVYDIWVYVTVSGKTGKRRVDAVLNLSAAPTS